MINNQLTIDRVIGKEMNTVCKSGNGFNSYLLYIDLERFAKDKITVNPVARGVDNNSVSLLNRVNVNSISLSTDILKKNLLVWIQNKKEGATLIINPNAKKLLNPSVTIHVDLIQQDIVHDIEIKEGNIIGMNGEDERQIRIAYNEFLDEELKKCKEQPQTKESDKSNKNCTIF